MSLPPLRLKVLEAVSDVPKAAWNALFAPGDRLVATLPAYLKTHSMGEYVYDFGWANAAAQFGVSYDPKLLVGMPLSPVTARKLHVAPGEDEAALRR